jgi:hypothetical protein
MAYVPPLNGGRINAQIGGNTAGNSTLVSTGTLTIAGGNNITLSQNNANAITIIGGAGGAAGTNTLGMSNLGNTSGTTGVISGTGLQFALAGGNNVTLSQSINGSSATITVSAASQTNQTANFYVHGNSTQLSSTAGINLSAVTFQGAGPIYMGVSEGKVLASGATSSLQGTGIVNISTNGSTISIGAPAFSAGVSTGGSTLGNTGMVNSRVVFVGTNVTLSQSQDNGSATITISAGAAGNGVALSGTDALITSGTASFQATGAASISVNGQVISIGAPVQTNQTLSQAVTGNTTGNTSGMSVDARSLTMEGLGIVSAGISTSAGGSSLIVSATQSNQAASAANGSYAFQTLSFSNANGVSFGTSAGSAITASINPSGGGVALEDGVNSITSGTASFDDANGVSFGINGQTVTASVAAQSAQTANFYVSSNSTIASTTAGVDLRSVTFQGAGGVSFGVTDHKVLASAPDVSSLNVDGVLTMSTNNTNITLGVPAETVMSMPLGIVNRYTTNTISFSQNSLYLFPAIFEASASGSVIKMPVNVTHGSTNINAHTRGYTALLGVYTRHSTNSTVLTRHYSTSYTAGFFASTSRTMSISVITGLGNSTSYNTISSSSTNHTLSSIINGSRELMIAFASHVSPGEYWLGFANSSSSAGGAGALWSLQFPINATNTSAFNALGVSVNTTGGVFRYMGLGTYSATTGAMPAGISMTEVNPLSYYPMMYFQNASS